MLQPACRGAPAQRADGVLRSRHRRRRLQQVFDGFHVLRGHRLSVARTAIWLSDGHSCWKLDIGQQLLRAGSERETGS